MWSCGPRISKLLDAPSRAATGSAVLDAQTGARDTLGRREPCNGQRRRGSCHLGIWSVVGRTQRKTPCRARPAPRQRFVSCAARSTSALAGSHAWRVEKGGGNGRPVLILGSVETYLYGKVPQTCIVSPPSPRDVHKAVPCGSPGGVKPCPPGPTARAAVQSTRQLRTFLDATPP